MLGAGSNKVDSNSSDNKSNPKSEDEKQIN